MPLPTTAVRLLAAAPLALGLAACASFSSSSGGLEPTGAGIAGASKREVQRLTYFTSAPIQLVRFDDPQASRAGRGNLQRMTIPAGTPGVVAGSGEGWLALRFEGRNYLYFTEVADTLDGSRIGDTRIAGRYYLHLPDWDGHAGTVKFGDGTWLAVGESRNVYLLNDRDARPSQGARGDATLSSRWLDEKH